MADPITRLRRAMVAAGKAAGRHHYAELQLPTFTALGLDPYAYGVYVRRRVDAQYPLAIYDSDLSDWMAGRFALLLPPTRRLLAGCGRGRGLGGKARRLRKHGPRADACDNQGCQRASARSQERSRSLLAGKTPREFVREKYRLGAVLVEHCEPEGEVFGRHGGALATIWETIESAVELLIFRLRRIAHRCFPALF